jgi:hypothetical protein
MGHFSAATAGCLKAARLRIAQKSEGRVRAVSCQAAVKRVSVTAVTCWRPALAIGTITGTALLLLGIYTQTTWLRLVGACVPLPVLAAGLVLDRRSRGRCRRRSQH